MSEIGAETTAPSTALPVSEFLRRLGYVVEEYRTVTHIDGGERLTLSVRAFPGNVLAVRPRHDGVLIACIQDDC